MSELPYEIAQGHQHDRASADQGLRLQAQPVPAARRELHGILPLQEVLSGEIPKKYLLPLLASRLAEDAANALPDGSPERADLLSVSDDVEN
jgi:hypothetical protein